MLFKAYLSILTLVEQVGLLKFKQRGVILIKPLQHLCHDGFPHEFCPVGYFIFLTIEVDGLLFPLVKPDCNERFPYQLLIADPFFFRHSVVFNCLKILIVCAFPPFCFRKELTRFQQDVSNMAPAR